MEFFTDGAPVLRSLTSYLSAESTHLLAWFHLTTRLTGLPQYALGLAQVDAAGGQALQNSLKRIKWHLWHGNAEPAAEKITDLDATLAAQQDDPLLVKNYGKLKSLARLITDFQAYVEQNSAFIVDYAERQRHGEHVSTGFVESAVNQVLAKRLVKRQQMQGTRKGGIYSYRLELRCSMRSEKTVFASRNLVSGHCRRKPFRWPLSPVAPHFLVLFTGCKVGRLYKRYTDPKTALGLSARQQLPSAVAGASFGCVGRARQGSP